VKRAAPKSAQAKKKPTEKSAKKKAAKKKSAAPEKRPASSRPSAQPQPVITTTLTPRPIAIPGAWPFPMSSRP
jgi:hypothetical protein